MEVFSFLIERGQQDGKDISHNSDTEGEGGVGSERINPSPLDKRNCFNKAGCETGGVDCVFSCSGEEKVRRVHDDTSDSGHIRSTGLNRAHV